MPPRDSSLSRRERQIMDALYKLGEGSVTDVVKEMGDGAGYHSVRVILGLLQKRGIVKHRKDGVRYVFTPTVPPASASATALRHLLKTFYAGSPSKAVMALLDTSGAKLSPRDLDEIAAWIRQAKKESR